MKRKKINQNLVLSKRTVANLITTELNDVQGGLGKTDSMVSKGPWICAETYECTCKCGPITLATLQCGGSCLEC